MFIRLAYANSRTTECCFAKGGIMNYKDIMIGTAIYPRLKQKKFISESVFDEIREQHEILLDLWYEKY